MSISEKFEPLADRGFYQTIEPAAAKRQFNMSLGLMALLSLVALIVGLSAGFGPLPATMTSTRQARLVVQQPHRVHVMQAEAQSAATGG